MRLLHFGYPLLLAFAVMPAPAASGASGPSWIYAASPNFELITTESAGRARDALVRFEQIRAFFVQASKSLRLPSYPVRIVAFRSENEYRVYNPIQGSMAYYQPGVHHDTIVMKSLESEAYPVAVHEFVHLVLHNSKAQAPLWLNEGLAELYSTLKPAGRNNLLVGDMIPGRLAALSRLKLVELETLLSVDMNWLSKASRDDMGAFYAQSWALTHMLALSDGYRAKFSLFLSQVFAGAEAGAALQSVFGRTLGQVRGDLQSYLQGSMFRAFVYPFGLDKTGEQPETRAATALEWRAALADLDASRPDRAERAREAYSKLAAEFPQAWQPMAGLGYVALAAGDREAAARDFARAEELGCNDPRIFLHWAMFAPPVEQREEYTRILRKAIEMRPDDLEIRYRGGVGLAAVGECSSAMVQLLTLKTVTPDQAPDYLKAVVRCGSVAGFEKEAKAAAKQLSGLARTAAEKDEADHYIRMANGQRGRYVLDPVGTESVEDSRTQSEGEQEEERQPREAASTSMPGPATFRYRPLEEYKSAEGRLVQVDCTGKSAKVWIQDGTNKSAFAIPDGAAITLLKEGKDVVDELTCGPQAQPPRVRVRYSGPPEREPTVHGTVRTLEFL